MIAVPSSAPRDCHEWLADYRARLQASIKTRKPPEEDQQELERIIVIPE